jgi:hypothetical protein
LPRFLSGALSNFDNTKVALILIDGLAMDQWVVIREELSKESSDLRINENAVFAWVPTITSVSRQAAFSGKVPMYFPNSINTTDKEEALWNQFWNDNGLTSDEVLYKKGIDDTNYKELLDGLSNPKVRVAGIIIDKVDRIMHGIELGKSGMYNQVKQWASQGFLNSIIKLLDDGGFNIFLTSDHGNVEASGCGRPSEGSIAYSRGERVRIYPNEILRATVKERFSSAVEWPIFGLPKGYYPLIAPDGYAFIPEGKTTVAHGGFSIEELIVPFIHIARSSQN